MAIWIIGGIYLIALGFFLVGAINTILRALMAVGLPTSEVSLDLHLVEVSFQEKDEKTNARYEIQGYYRYFDASERVRFLIANLRSYSPVLDDLPGHLQEISGTAHILISDAVYKRLSQKELNRIRSSPLSTTESLKYRFPFGSERLGTIIGDIGADLLMLFVGGFFVAALVYSVWSGEASWVGSLETFRWITIIGGMVIIGGRLTRSPFFSEAKYPIAGTIWVREGIHPIYHDSRLEYKLREIKSLADEGKSGS